MQNFVSVGMGSGTSGELRWNILLQILGRDAYVIKQTTVMLICYAFLM